LAPERWRRRRPYEFKDAATLIEDFMNAVERVLTERGVPANVVADSDEGK
jgi:hypothetical protein